MPIGDVNIVTLAENLERFGGQEPMLGNQVGQALQPGQIIRRRQITSAEAGLDLDAVGLEPKRSRAPVVFILPKISHLFPLVAEFLEQAARGRHPACFQVRAETSREKPIRSRPA